jgi:excisionase family DNA binding protein
VNTEPLLTAREVARFFQVAPKTVYQWAALGQLPCVRVGGVVRFRRGDIELLVEDGVAT